MAKQVNVRTTKETREALERLVDEGEADSRAGAMRKAARESLEARGYLDGHTPMTGLRRSIRTVGAWFMLFAVAWVGLTYWYSIAWRLPAAGLVMSGLFCYGVDRLLARHEPKLSNRLSALFGGATA